MTCHNKIRHDEIGRHNRKICHSINIIDSYEFMHIYRSGLYFIYS